MAEEIKFLREQIIEKNFTIRSLFLLKLSDCEEDNFSYKIIKTVLAAKISLKIVLIMKSSRVNL